MMIQMMTEFYEKLNTDSVTEEDIIRNKEYLNFNHVVYTYKDENKELLKTVLNNIMVDEIKICRYFIYKDDFDEYVDILIEKLKFYENIDWININISKISNTAINFCLENLDKFKNKLSDSDYVYLQYKKDRTISSLYNKNMDIHCLFHYCINNKYFDTCDFLSRDNYNYNMTFIISTLQLNNVSSFIWLISFIKRNSNTDIFHQNIEINDILLDLFHSILRSKNINLYNLFVTNFEEYIKSNLNIYYEQFKIYGNKEIFDLFFFKFKETFDRLINIEQKKLKYSQEYIFNIFNEHYKIEFTENIFWDIFDTKLLYEQYDFIKEIHNKYPEFKITEFKNFAFSLIRDVNVLIYLESKYSNKLKELVSYMVTDIFNCSIYYNDDNNNSIYDNEFKIMEWCVLNYKDDLDLKEFEIYNVDILKLMEKYYKIPIYCYDIIMKKSCKSGKINIINHINSLYKDRYILTFDKYLFINTNNQFKKTFKVKINMIKNHLKMNESLECVICLDNKYKIYQTSCNHNYCIECFNKWFEKNIYKCVYCRQNFENINLIEKNDLN